MWSNTSRKASSTQQRKSASQICHRYIFSTLVGIRATKEVVAMMLKSYAGHSMTIVGFERLKTGEKNLIVFDPMFHDPSSVTRLVGRSFTHKFPDLLLKPYRRGSKYLKKYREFELLRFVLPGRLRELPIAVVKTDFPPHTLG
jgi:hypothetical protein